MSETKGEQAKKTEVKNELLTSAIKVDDKRVCKGDTSCGLGWCDVCNSFLERKMSETKDEQAKKTEVKNELLTSTIKANDKRVCNGDTSCGLGWCDVCNEKVHTYLRRHKHNQTEGVIVVNKTTASKGECKEDGRGGAGCQTCDEAVNNKYYRSQKVGSGKTQNDDDDYDDMPGLECAIHGVLVQNNKCPICEKTRRSDEVSKRYCDLHDLRYVKSCPHCPKKRLGEVLVPSLEVARKYVQDVSKCPDSKIRAYLMVDKLRSLFYLAEGVLGTMIESVEDEFSNDLSLTVTKEKVNEVFALIQQEVQHLGTYILRG